LAAAADLLADVAQAGRQAGVPLVDPVHGDEGQRHGQHARNDPGRRAAAYLQDLADSGNFPNLAGIGTAGLLHNEHDELTFETGLNWLLTGIAADA